MLFAISMPLFSNFYLRYTFANLVATTAILIADLYDQYMLYKNLFIVNQMAQALDDVNETNGDRSELEEKIDNNPQIGGMLLRRMTTMNADRKSVMAKPKDPSTEDKDED